MGGRMVSGVCEFCGDPYLARSDAAKTQRCCSARCASRLRSRERGVRLCNAAACTRCAVSLGYCAKHYARFRKHGDPHTLKNHPTAGVCSVPGCQGAAKVKKLCGAHYIRLKKHGTVQPDRPVRRMSIRRSASMNRDGYLIVHRPEHPNATKSGRILLHRAVMSAVLGRPLQPSETVHHRNGQRADNRPANLELWAKNHGPAQRVDDLIEAALATLSAYAPELLA